MNNSMVAHLWANEKKESARGSNLFFEGRSIYSYGYHFEVGRIVRNKCGEKAYLLNDKYYSSPTCKHQHCVRSAIPTGSKVFSVGYNMSDDGSMGYHKIGSIFKYNIDSKEVELEVVESSDASCEGCAFNNSKNYYCKDTHCIDVDRKDDIDVIYKKVKRS